MKNLDKCDLQNYLTDRIAKACKEKGVFKGRFAERLLAAGTASAASKGRDCSCCTLSFIVYLCFFCRDVNGLIGDLRRIILDAYDETPHA